MGSLKRWRRAEVALAEARRELEQGRDALVGDGAGIREEQLLRGADVGDSFVS